MQRLWSPCRNTGSSGESALFYVSTSEQESSLHTHIMAPCEWCACSCCSVDCFWWSCCCCKKGKAAASRFPNAKIALQGRMAAWRSHALTPHMPETGSLILAHKKPECWLEKMRFYNASKASQGKTILSTRYPITPMLQRCQKKRLL